MWQIRYPSTLQFLLYELKRVALGEFMDDLDVGNQVNEMIGLPPNENSSTDEAVGEERLGSGSITQSFGATLLLCTMIFVAIVLVIVIIIFIARRVELSDKRKAQVKNLKTKVFWNPIVRYLQLNSMKLYMSSIVAMNVASKSTADLGSSIAILTLLICTPLVFWVTLSRNKDSLTSSSTKKEISAIYVGKNVTSPD